MILVEFHKLQLAIDTATSNIPVFLEVCLVFFVVFISKWPWTCLPCCSVVSLPKVMKKSSMKPGGTESAWCQLGKTSVILVHWFMLSNPQIPNCQTYTNPNNNSNSNLPNPNPQPPPPWAARRLLDFDETFGYRVPFSLQTCVLKLVGLGSKQPWNAWPAPMVSGHEGNQWFSCPLRRPFVSWEGG